MSTNRLPDNVVPIWTPRDSIETAQAFALELDNAERGRPLTTRSRERRARRMDALAVALLMALMAALGVIAFSLAAPNAKADSDSEAYAYAAHYAGAVCATLDDYPTVNGMLGIMQAIAEDGLSDFQAGQVVGLSITETCPRYSYLLDLFIDRYGRSVVA